MTHRIHGPECCCNYCDPAEAMATTPELKIGVTVRVLRENDVDMAYWNGRKGKLIRINERNTDGDFYGVSFSGEPNLFDVVFFWRDELEVVE